MIFKLHVESPVAPYYLRGCNLSVSTLAGYRALHGALDWNKLPQLGTGEVVGNFRKEVRLEAARPPLTDLRYGREECLKPYQYKS